MLYWPNYSKDFENERVHVPGLDTRDDAQEFGGVRQHGLPRTAHLRLCSGGQRLKKTYIVGTSPMSVANM